MMVKDIVFSSCLQRAIVGEFGLPYKAVTGAELEVTVGSRTVVYVLSSWWLYVESKYLYFLDHFQSLKERLGQVVRSLGQISPSGM